MKIAEIIANNFEYDLKNIINADQNVKIENKEDNATIFSDKITYFRNEELYKTKGSTQIISDDIYDFISSDVVLSKKKKILF